jgi:hypothetical protein
MRVDSCEASQAAVDAACEEFEKRFPVPLDGSFRLGVEAVLAPAFQAMPESDALLKSERAQVSCTAAIADARKACAARDEALAQVQAWKDAADCETPQDLEGEMTRLAADADFAREQHDETLAKLAALPEPVAIDEALAGRIVIAYHDTNAGPNVEDDMLSALRTVFGNRVSVAWPALASERELAAPPRETVQSTPPVVKPGEALLKADALEAVYALLDVLAAHFADYLRARARGAANKDHAKELHDSFTAEWLAARGPK